MMRTMDLNESELGVLRDIISDDMRSMTVEDARKVRYDKRLEFCELLSAFMDMTPEKRQYYLGELPDKQKDIKLAEDILKDRLERREHLKDSAHAILGMDQATWDKLSDETQTGILEAFELIKQADQEITEKDLDSRTPEEIRTILTASQDEWGQLPDSLTNAVMEKFEKLAG